MKREEASLHSHLGPAFIRASAVVCVVRYVNVKDLGRGVCAYGHKPLGLPVGGVWLSLPALHPSSLGFSPMRTHKCHINIFLYLGFCFS